MQNYNKSISEKQKNITKRKEKMTVLYVSHGFSYGTWVDPYLNKKHLHFYHGVQIWFFEVSLQTAWLSCLHSEIGEEEMATIYKTILLRRNVIMYQTITKIHFQMDNP